jgi:hypothetical protein
VSEVRRALAIVMTITAIGCGPDIKETRLGFYPPRESHCSLEFVQADARAMGPGGPWEVLGYISVSEKHVENPFSEKYRAIVRPRACNMGGEAVTLMQAGSRESHHGSSSGTTWGVLRYRRAPGAPQPGQF